MFTQEGRSWVMISLYFLKELLNCFPKQLHLLECFGSSCLLCPHFQLFLLHFPGLMVADPAVEAEGAVG